MSRVVSFAVLDLFGSLGRNLDAAEAADLDAVEFDAKPVGS
jgi:hypothetical protein